MAKTRKTYDLAEVIERELAKKNDIIIKAGDKTFTVPPSILWPDKVFDVSDAEGARLILGDQYDAFCEAGGNAKLLFLIYAEHNGASLPE
jgi:hypothetical protein